MTDIILNDDLSIAMSNGDFTIGDGTLQHIELLMKTAKGDWTRTSWAGVGLVRWVNGRLDGRLEREIELQIETDGITGVDVTVNSQGIVINKNA